MTTKERFLQQYGGLEFTNVTFRPGAPFTVGFGFDKTFNAFRLHNAIDRGNLGKDPEKNRIYAPFDNYATWQPEADGGFGSMLTLTTEFGFEVRIMHMEDVAAPIKNSNARNAAGAFLGSAGNKGLSTGIHTHVEVISLRETCELLNSILSDKFSDAVIRKFYTEQDAIDYILKHGLTEDAADPAAGWRREIAKRRIRSINQYCCIRNDYKDGKLKTFYNSQALFGM